MSSKKKGLITIFNENLAAVAGVTYTVCISMWLVVPSGDILLNVDLF
jgi:hypothetical protein